MSLPMRLALVTVAILGLWPRDNAAKGRPADPLGRLMGPFASLLASAEWVRFDLALYEGRPEAAYAHAERALDLDPGAVAGWQYLAHHLIFERGSELEAGSPDERRAWIQAGIERRRKARSTSTPPRTCSSSRPSPGPGWPSRTRQGVSIGPGERAWPASGRTGP